MRNHFTLINHLYFVKEKGRLTRANPLGRLIFTRVIRSVRFERHRAIKTRLPKFFEPRIPRVVKRIQFKIIVVEIRYVRRMYPDGNAAPGFEFVSVDYVASIRPTVTETSPINFFFLFISPI